MDSRRISIMIASSAIALSLTSAGAVAVLGVDSGEGALPSLDSQASQLAGRAVQIRHQTGSPGFDSEIATYVEESSRDVYYVDQAAQRVVAFHDISALEQLYGAQQGERMSAAGLLQFGRQYVGENLQEKWSQCEPTLEIREVGATVEGSRISEARVVFREYLEGIPTCNFVELTMDPVRGSIAGVLVSDGSIGVSKTTPTVPAERAVDTFEDATDMIGAKVVTSELFVWRLPSSDEAHLTWHIVLQTGSDEAFGATARGYVDALTGEVLFYGR